MPVQLDDDEARNLYEVLNGCQRVLKYQEQAEAARQGLEKPDPYSPLVLRLMDARNSFGDKVAALPPESQD